MAIEKTYRLPGKYYEEFIVGDHYVSPSRTVTEADIVNFSCYTSDMNLVHTDEEYAKKMPSKGRIAQGVLVLSLALGLTARLQLLDSTGLAFLECTTRFKGFVKIGDTITVHTDVVGKRETKKDDRGIVSMKLNVVNQRQETVLEADTVTMILRQPK